jgi:hypothetical protein
MSLARAGAHGYAFVQPRRGKTKPLGGFTDRLDDQAVTPLAHDPGVDVLRALSPIELGQDRTAAVMAISPSAFRSSRYWPMIRKASSILARSSGLASLMNGSLLQIGLLAYGGQLFEDAFRSRDDKAWY